MPQPRNRDNQQADNQAQHKQRTPKPEVKAPTPENETLQSPLLAPESQNLQAQASSLNNPNIPMAQRQMMARNISHTHGNSHMIQVVNRLNRTATTPDTPSSKSTPVSEAGEETYQPEASPDSAVKQPGNATPPPPSGGGNSQVTNEQPASPDAALSTPEMLNSSLTQAMHKPAPQQEAGAGEGIAEETTTTNAKTANSEAKIGSKASDSDAAETASEDKKAPAKRGQAKPFNTQKSSTDSDAEAALYEALRAEGLSALGGGSEDSDAAQTLESGDDASETTNEQDLRYR